MEARSIVEQPDGGSDRTVAGGDELRSQLHGMWASVAGSWAEHAEYADARGAAAAEEMLDLTRPRPGERVLELACGPGGLGLAAARRVAPGGQVVMSDVAAEMTAIASTRADALGLSNVSTRVLDVEHIEEPDGSYDVVLCREGLMFAVDPARAAREIRRVLRPGGRFAVAVWGPRAGRSLVAPVRQAPAHAAGSSPALPGSSRHSGCRANAGGCAESYTRRLFARSGEAGDPTADGAQQEPAEQVTSRRQA